MQRKVTEVVLEELREGGGGRTAWEIAKGVNARLVKKVDPGVVAGILFKRAEKPLQKDGGTVYREIGRGPTGRAAWLYYWRTP